MKILIAEDEPVSRTLLSAALRKLVHVVMVAENGRDALDVCNRERVPLVISDWMMPEMDGLELCRQIRARNFGHYTYFTLLTTLSGKQHFLDGLAAGADDFITKPFDLDQLAARLRVAARILHLQDEVKQLKDLLPVCAWCNLICDDRQNWVPLENYVATRLGTSISHSICPACLAAKTQHRAGNSG